MASLTLHTWSTEPARAQQPYIPVNACPNAHKLLMAMHKPESGAREKLNLTAHCFPADYGAASARLLGWYVDEYGKAQQSLAGNLQVQLLLCQKQLAASQALVLQKDQQLSAVSVQNGLLQRAGMATAAELSAAQQSAAPQAALRAATARY